MLNIYVIGLIIGACLLVALSILGVFGISEAGWDKENWRGFSSFFFVGTVLVFVWPLILPVALLSFLGYGGWTTARAIKNKSYRYDLENEE